MPNVISECAGDGSQVRPVVCVRESARARERESERERKFVCGGGKVRRMDLLVCYRKYFLLCRKYFFIYYI